MTDHTRSIDRWLKWAALLGPLMGFVFGVCAGGAMAYQAYQQNSGKIGLLEGWKDRQELFNLETVKAIARLKALIKDTQ